MKLDNDHVMLLRIRVEDAIQQRRDPVGAVVDALREIEMRRFDVLRSVKRVEIHRGAKNRYVIHIAGPTEDGVIDLDQDDLADGPKAFSTQYLQHFDVLPAFAKGSWPQFVENLLHGEHVVEIEGREDLNEEELAVEGFVERAQRWKPTRDIHESIRDSDKVYWEDETGHVLVRSERVSQYLRSTGYVITPERFAFVLKARGIVVRPTFQKKVPPPDDGGKTQNLRFWRLNAPALGLTERDILPATPTDLPPEPPEGAATEDTR